MRRPAALAFLTLVTGCGLVLGLGDIERDQCLDASCTSTAEGGDGDHTAPPDTPPPPPAPGSDGGPDADAADGRGCLPLVCPDGGLLCDPFDGRDAGWALDKGTTLDNMLFPPCGGPSSLTVTASPDTSIYRENGMFAKSVIDVDFYPHFTTQAGDVTVVDSQWLDPCSGTPQLYHSELLINAGKLALRTTPDACGGSGVGNLDDFGTVAEKWTHVRIESFLDPAPAHLVVTIDYGTPRTIGVPGLIGVPYDLRIHLGLVTRNGAPTSRVNYDNMVLLP
jgi:hypothetical protein